MPKPSRKNTTAPAKRQRQTPLQPPFLGPESGPGTRCQSVVRSVLGPEKRARFRGRLFWLLGPEFGAVWGGGKVERYTRWHLWPSTDSGSTKDGRVGVGCCSCSVAVAFPSYDGHPLPPALRPCLTMLRRGRAALIGWGWGGGDGGHRTALLHSRRSSRIA